MRHVSLVPAALAIGLAASVPVARLALGQAPAGAPTMPLSEVKPGMKGHGLTVFRGTDPERFDVEILGIQHNFLPAQDLILVKTTHPRLDVAHVVAGMSGSPIFLDGKMIGAYAYGYSFNVESIAGVTPIRAMLDEQARPIPPVFQPLGGAAAPDKRARADAPSRGELAWSGPIERYDVLEHARQVAARVAPADPAGAGAAPRPFRAMTPVFLGGMSERAAAAARALLEPLGLDPVQAGGGRAAADPAAPTRYVDGGAIGVELVRGDVSIMGMGTVTRVEGDKVLGFGHPMLRAGVCQFPTSIGRILWILASQARSFKIGESVRPVGALVNDRQAAIVVDQKAPGLTFPVTLDISGVDGAPKPRWSMEVAQHRLASPLFSMIAIASAVEATTQELRDATWHATTEVVVRGQGTVTVHDFGVMPSGPSSYYYADWVPMRALRALGAVMNNPWEPVWIERVASRMQVRFARDTVRLRGTEVLEDVVDAGGKARLRLHLVPYAGREETRVVEVPIPAELAGKEVEIELVPGYSDSPEVPSPENVADLVRNLSRQTFPPDVLIASLKLPEGGVSHRGHVARRIPPGALDTLRPLHDTTSPESIPSIARTIVPIQRIVEGRDRVRVRVRQPVH